MRRQARALTLDFFLQSSLETGLHAQRGGLTGDALWLVKPSSVCKQGRAIPSQPRTI